MPDSTDQTLRHLSEQGLLRFPDPVIWIDEYGHILRANAAACQLYGYAAEQFRKLRVFDLNPQLDETDWQEHWRRDRQQSAKIQTIHRKADGRTIPVEVVNCWETIDGITYSCSICRDVSERQHREHNLQRLWTESRQRDRQALLSQFSVDRTRDIVVWTCPAANIKFANPAAERILGYTRDELLRMDVFAINTAMTPEKLASLWRRLRSQGHALMESTHRTRDGRDIPVEINVNRIVHEGHEFACSIARDITERKEREEQLQSAFAEIKLLKEKVEAENQYLHRTIQEQEWQSEIITQSERMRLVLNQVERVAPTGSTVLILGESGTGKELIANAIYRFGRLSEGPFVKVNCAALPESLIESELFGHEKGAFTGAFQRKIGKFELADGGTIFLDEIGEFPLALQAKLLRVLQEGTFERLGGNETLRTQVRIVAATNRDLEAMVRAGEFRQDLYFRLFVFPIELPPLRERPEDIPLLVQHFSHKYQTLMGKTIRDVAPATLARLQAYAFPGNVRELENLVERAIIMSTDQRLEIGDWLLPEPAAAEAAPPHPQLSLAEAQREHIIRTLQATGWRVSGRGGAAELLDLPSTTLRSKMQKLGIRRSSEAAR